MITVWIKILEGNLQISTEKVTKDVFVSLNFVLNQYLETHRVSTYSQFVLSLKVGWYSAVKYIYNLLLKIVAIE